MRRTSFVPRSLRRLRHLALAPPLPHRLDALIFTELLANARVVVVGNTELLAEFRRELVALL